MNRSRLIGSLATLAFIAACSAATPTNTPVSATPTGAASTAAGSTAPSTAGGTSLSPTTSASGGGGGGAIDRGSITIEVVTHGQASDPFWSVVKNGVDGGAKDMGVKANYSAPDTFDMIKMASLIDAAVAKKPSALVISLPDATALGNSVKAAVAAKIPVFTINSGSDTFQSLGVLVHIGQTEEIAGRGAGDKMAAAGVKNALCVNQEVGNAALELRCKGFTAGIEAGGGKVKVVQVDLKDPTGAQNTITAALAADTTVDGMLTLGPTGAAPALAALTAGGQLGKIKLATFDLSKDVLNAILTGNMLFAIDQQQYLQGYLAIVFATNYVQYGLLPGGGGVVLTGPGFVTKDNAQQVLDLQAAGVR
jgi:simple sugar transport system substrate-binding protein